MKRVIKIHLRHKTKQIMSAPTPPMLVWLLVNIFSFTVEPALLHQQRDEKAALAALSQSAACVAAAQFYLHRSGSVALQLWIPRSHFSRQHNLMSRGGCCHVNSGTLAAQVSSQRRAHGANAVLSSSSSSQHHGSQSEKRSVQKVSQAVVPPSVLLLKPAACLSAAAVSARPRLFLRPCCSTTSNCAHRQITLQGGEEGRAGHWTPTRQWPGTHRPLVSTSHKTPAGFCSGSVSLVELVCDEDSAAPSFTLTNYENEVNKTMRVAQGVVFYSFDFIRHSALNSSLVATARARLGSK